MQERAKDLALDIGGADGAGRLRELIDDEVARWTDDFKRGARARSTSPTPTSWPSGRTATSPATDRSSRCSPTTTSGRS